MAKTSTKLKRWSHLDHLLSEGKPVSMFDIYMSYATHPDKSISLIDDTAKTLRMSREEQVELFERAYRSTLRKDLDIFKKALIAHGKDDMLLVGKGAEDKKFEDGKDKRTKTYCYRETGFSVIPFLTSEMSDAEYRKLVAAINKLKGVLSDQNFEEIRFAVQSRVEADFDKGANCVEYEDNRRLKGREYRPIIYNAILGKSALRLLYQKFNGEIIGPFEFHPYLLKQYNDRWFVFGYRPDVDNYYYNVPLDRLMNKPEIIGQHNSCRPTDYLSHFENIVGVTKEANLKEKEILIKIKEINTWGRVTTKPLKTQTIVSEFDRTNKFGVISLRVVPNHELYSRILSWGTHVEILSPKSVRNKFKGILQSMISGYDTLR